VAGVGSAGWAWAGGAAAGVEVEFVAAYGVVQRTPLSGCWNVAFERVARFGGLRRSAGSEAGSGVHAVASPIGGSRASSAASAGK
jgi:hypothetical protein